ncbi:type II toxin-antitoxin system VapC family toxin [Nocardiopsis sp. CNT312]|uniref:type II toxin-antitoxin system VapC family toxin n=1 Tax=Nocardiopsis sp. CNT312 TaxID=1137268 RepID=UPI0004B590C8|nr:type II toxin-antitoxin system VapC family toxin [Nocardiopsis sp. CNT312]
MGRRLILDTNILISYERDALDRSLFDQDELAIAAVTVAEFRAGIELTDTVKRAAARSRALAEILTYMEVLDYTEATAVHHSRLIAHTIAGGRKRGALDLMVAAHAAQTGRTVVSRDAKVRFGDLPGVLATGVE